MDSKFGMLMVAAVLGAILAAPGGSASAASPPPSSGIWEASAGTSSDNHSVEVSGVHHRHSTVKSKPNGAQAATRAKAEGVRLSGHKSFVRSTQVQALITRACSEGAVCDGRQGSSLNPIFAGVTEPAGVGKAEKDNLQVPERIVTLEDLARFLPATVVLHAEPEGWAVVGVPANFWTVVRPIAVDGQLLGEEAAVRFTPRLYEWRYGDGDSKVTQSDGSSWAGAGQEELTATSTSHVYADKQAAQASVTVYWSAEYRFADGDWIPVEGAVSNTSPEQRMLVVKERTVLTAR